MPSPQRYRKRPLEIEAMRFDGSNQDEILSWAQAIPDHTPIWVETMGGETEIIIRTTSGEATARAGWWICRGVENELYPCKPSVFEATYEAVESVERVGNGSAL